MGESEKFEAQGRAHAQLKEARSTIATIEAELLRYSRLFRDLGEPVEQFAHDPAFKNDAYISLSGHIKAQATQIPRSEESAPG